MTDRSAFVAAICAAPTDVTLRLVYADWVEENLTDPADPEEQVDRARAQMIRLDAEIDRLRPLHWREAGFGASHLYGDHMKGLIKRRDALISSWLRPLLRTTPFPQLFDFNYDQFGHPGLWRYGFVYRTPPLNHHKLIPTRYSTPSMKPQLLRLVFEHPVCELQLAAFHPQKCAGKYRWSNAVGSSYTYYYGNGETTNELFPNLRPDGHVSQGGRLWAVYASKPAACADLYRAAVRMLRTEIGLPDVDLTAMARPPTYGRTSK